MLVCVQDVDKCIAIMKELHNVEMTANLLLKHSDIVTTIRRVRPDKYPVLPVAVWRKNRDGITF